uniref:Transposase, MuDR, MULE transposase domain protein n=1 Tax=Tanacetum cinerariifolium TaxID=118510 RepID=A0A6L2JFC1_TANCI|nr:hypothetical protein [Tanacetum cinerariifolium]
MEFNIDITYKKAWGGRNKALEINSGCPIESFSQFPYYFYNLKMASEGTITHIKTDDEGRFKICFVAFGFAIRSFLTHMRPLVITDGAHLKGTYKGTNLVLVGMDGNNQLIPIATGVSQSETGESWTWHLMMNCKLKSGKLKCIFWKTCKAYTPEEFQRRIFDLWGLRPKAYQKLKDVGFETWSRAMCPANRHNYMTINSAESITRHVRKAPITMLMEWYRALLQKWYCACREKYQDSSVHTLSDWATHKVMDGMQKSANWKVYGIHWGIPYGHVIAVGRVMRCTDYSDIALGWFRKTTFYSTYQELVYPVWEPWQLAHTLVTSQSCYCRLVHTLVTSHDCYCRLSHTAQYETAYSNNHGRSQEYAQAYNNMIGRSQEYEPAYNNMIERSQEYEPSYTNNHRRSQEYKIGYNNMIQMSQEYPPAYNNNNGRSQEYEAFGQRMPFSFNQFNVGQTLQHIDSSVSFTWDTTNLAEAQLNLF